MPINGISGEFRPPRYAKLRLGYKKKGERGEYPKDTDVFVGRIEDGVTKQMIDAYNGEKITEAEGETWNLGKSLRMLSYFEWDAMHPRKNTELVVNLLNRAWSHSKLKCSGTGGDEPGEAFVRDEAFVGPIQKATKEKPVRTAGGWKVICLGPGCPMWHANNKADKLATCHRELRFLAQLLHPTTDPADPQYLKNFGSVEIVSGSFNGMVDVQSGLQLLRSVAGRSANIPFTLQRKPRTMLVEGKRVVKATLLVGFDNDEAIRFGYSDPKLSLVRPEIRKQLLAQKRELLELARLEVNFDAVRDIQPRLEEHREPAPASDESMHQSSIDAPPDVVGDRDQVVGEAAAAALPSEAELSRRLNQGERDELKVLCGGIPGDRDSQAHFRELVLQAYERIGDWQDKWDRENPPLSELCLRHALWIRQAIEAEKGA